MTFNIYSIELTKHLMKDSQIKIPRPQYVKYILSLKPFLKTGSKYLGNNVFSCLNQIVRSTLGSGFF